MPQVLVETLFQILALAQLQVSNMVSIAWSGASILPALLGMSATPHGRGLLVGDAS